MTLRTLAIACSLLAFACGGDATGPANDPPSIAGSWDYSESFSSASAGVSCQDEGTIVISQSGTNFTGSANQVGICTDSGGNTYDNSGTGTVQGGQISGSQVSFVAGGCDYTGSVSGSPPNRMSGSVSCTVAVGGTNYEFTGTWSAGR